MLLAQETSKSLDEEIDLYRQGVEAGEMALGKKAFKEGVGHFWGILETRPYMRARKQGYSPSASKSLKAALKGNKHVPAYLLGRKKMPRSLPGHYGFGDDNEAIVYVDDNKAAWKATPSALEWLAERSEKD
ncbi:MAG: hypothetical protein Q8J64_08670 [Thermodesulfovibrionales bacterium]|nr:hypothetical protein [Thermodesulfovibrionales bacterium]